MDVEQTIEKGRALLAEQRVEEARWLARKLATRAADRADVALFLAEIDRQSGNLASALTTLSTASRRWPKDAALLTACLDVAGQTGSAPDLLAAAKRMLVIHPDDSRALRIVYLEHFQKRSWTDESDALLPHVARAFADDPRLLTLAANSLCDAGEHDRAQPLYRSAAVAGDLIARGASAMALMYQDDVSAGQIFEAHRDVAAGLHVAGASVPQTPRWDGRRRLRVGYVSNDFRHHTVASYFEPLLKAHSRDRVEVFCYAAPAPVDAMTARLKSAAEHWRYLPDLTDVTAACRMIRDDAIDVLVDLSGFTNLPALQLFAHRSAPVQVSYLGYTNTTALPEMDYRVTDLIAGPAEPLERLYTEKLLRLDRPFYALTPPNDQPAVAPMGNSGTDAPIRFGVTANVPKIQPAILATWARLLQRLPGSTIEFLNFGAGRSMVRNRILATFVASGVAPARVTFTNGGGLTYFLSAHHRWDILLDTFPVSGHTTTIHALWMGLPVVALAGESYVSRLAASALHFVGLDELVAVSHEQYVEIAVALARDASRRTELRTSLRDRVRSSLMDASGPARRLEALYESIALRV